jgi:hypothetical protein
MFLGKHLLHAEILGRPLIMSRGGNTDITLQIANTSKTAHATSLPLSYQAPHLRNLFSCDAAGALTGIRKATRHKSFSKR